MMEGRYFPELPEHLRRQGEDEYFTHYVFYENVGRHRREGVCSACGERITVRHCPDGYPCGIEFYGDEDLWRARHNSEGECPHCGREVIYKAAGRAKSCHNLEETSNLVFFLPSEDGKTVYADCYTVLVRPRTYGRTVFHWYPKAKYIFKPGECYTEIYPYMLYNYFGRYGELMRTCGWHEIGYIQRSGDRPYEPWQGYMYNPADYYMVNVDALENTFLQYADLRRFAGIGHKDYAVHNGYMKYLWWYCHYPSLEICMRTGVYEPISNAVYAGTKSYADVDLNARRPWEFFRISKNDYRAWMAFFNKDRYEILQMIHKYKIVGEKAIKKLYDFYAICEHNIRTVERVCVFLGELQISRKDWLKYMRRQNEKADYWLDYVAMAKRHNMLDKIQPLPRDLVAAHNSLVSHLNEIAREQSLKEKAAYIRSVARRWPGVKTLYNKIRVKYSYEDQRYAIVVPSGIKDIFEDALRLDHCGARQDRYIERIATKETFIFFLRRKVDVKTPWYTLEVEPDGTIRQKRSFGGNQYDDINEAADFLRRWQKVVAERLSEEDIALSAVSRAKRKENYAELRRNGKRIKDGRFLADVLEADLQENLEVQVG